MSTQTLAGFASTVAPLYSVNGWLGSRSYADAYDRVHTIAYRLYRDAVAHAADRPGVAYKVSTGRVYAEYSPGSHGDLPEIELGLNLTTLIPDDDGVWTDVRAFRDE